MVLLSASNQTVYNNGTVNINGGTFKSENSYALYNDGSSSVMNIMQKDDPITIHSFDANNSDGNNSAIINRGVASLNIKGSKANACSSNPADTTEGLCIYSENHKSIKINRGNVNINGGTLISKNQAIDNQGGIVKIKNSYLKSFISSGIDNGTYFTINNGYDPGEYYICNSTIIGQTYDVYDRFESGSHIFYSNITFSNGTTTPDSSKIYGTITETPDACAW